MVEIRIQIHNGVPVMVRTNDPTVRIRVWQSDDDDDETRRAETDTWEEEARTTCPHVLT